MNRERWRRLKAIFQGAIEQPAESRRAWAREQCAGDDLLWREVEVLLDKHDTDGDLLPTPPIDPATVAPLLPGATLGSYRIVREIGRGGMGVVYLAKDKLDRDVAIKTLPPILAANPTLRERLRREAKAAGRIKHHAVATVYALEEIDGDLVIVSEYVQGDTLRTLLRGGASDEARAYSIAVDIAGALAAAHAASIIHRDLKPENVIITPDGEVKVVDFGIAQIDGDGVHLTMPGMMIGTPAYMSPEQLAGEPVTPRSDVYSFGVVFSEMLTGRYPLGIGRSASDDVSLRRDLPHDGGKSVGQVRPDADASEGRPAKSIPPHLAAIVARCMKLDPAERYASGRELLAALTAVKAPVVSVADSKTVPGSPRWWWEFHQAFIAVLYWLMTWPAWKGRQIVGGSIGRALFIATLIAVIVAATLRLHLWFTSRFYPAELNFERRRDNVWIRPADWVFVIALAATGILVGEDQSPPLAIVLLAVAVGAAIGFLVIERATARAAFRGSTTPHEFRNP